MAGEVAGELGDVAGLEAVVELLAHPGPQLVDEPSGVEAVEGQRREHAVHDLGPVEVLLDGRADAGELHLDRHGATLERRGPVDLADAGRGDGQVLPAGEHLLGLGAELGRRRRSAASVGAIGAASACSAASAAWASSGRPSAMKLTSWPSFISTPFISPSSLATSSAVRMANWVVELGPPLGRRHELAGLGAGVAGGVAGRQLPHPPRPPRHDLAQLAAGGDDHDAEPDPTRCRGDHPLHGVGATGVTGRHGTAAAVTTLQTETAPGSGRMSYIGPVARGGRPSPAGATLPTRDLDAGPVAAHPRHLHALPAGPGGVAGSGPLRRPGRQLPVQRVGPVRRRGPQPGVPGRPAG